MSCVQMLKLQSVKSEIRYTPNMILVKLVGSHSISQILLRISEIKRTKMVSGCALFGVVCFIWSVEQGLIGELVVSLLARSYSSPARVTPPLYCPTPPSVQWRCGPQRGDIHSQRCFELL